MNLEQYGRKGRKAYASLAKLVAKLLATSIHDHGGFRLQQVQHRAKDAASLRVKLQKTGVQESLHVEDEVKDLAGCRLIFYTNTDVAAFLSSGVLQEHFKVDWVRTKFHHPVPMASQGAGLFISNNFVVELSEKLAVRPEYASFRGMRCEVQVQTILNHAWSEMEHDIIYKRPPLEGFGGHLMSSIEERLQGVMRDHLIPAGYEFQKIVNDFERLSSGKNLFEEGPLAAILKCHDNNELYERLTSFREHVLPNYDDLESVQGEIRKTIISAMEAAQSRRSKPVDTPFGQLHGNTSDQVMDLAADILDRLRYLGEEAVVGTFDAICLLYKEATSDDQRQRLVTSAKRLSEHSLMVWERAGGPVVESILVERIQALDLDEIGAAKAVILEVLGQVLAPEVRGTTSTYNTLTIQTGAVDPSDLLVKVRTAAIDILLTMYRAGTSDGERRLVLQKLSEASRTPTMGNYPNALLAIALNDTARIVRFMTDLSTTQSHIILEEFEHDCLWHYRRCNPLPPPMEGDAELLFARDNLNKEIIKFRNQVNADQRFVTFKTLVGFQSVFPPAWENHDFDIHGIERYRKVEIEKLINQVSEDNAEEWFEVIAECASIQSVDLAMFPSFSSFLERLGAAKPQIVRNYIERLPSPLAGFLPVMLLGLEKTPLKDSTLDRVRRWVCEGEYLAQVTRYCQHCATLDIELLEETLQQAVNSHNEAAVLYAMQASVARFKESPETMVARVFLPALAYLTDLGRYGWVNAIWPRSENDGLFHSLTPDQQEEVLSKMVLCPDINFNAEQILKAIAAESPEKVVDFFGNRLTYEKGLKARRGYEEVPYKFHELGEVLRQIPGYLVAKARQWFEADPEFFAHRGGRVIAAVYPQPDADLLPALRALSATGDMRDMEFLIEILENYHGEVVLHPLFMDLVNALPEDSTRLVDISLALDSAGVVSGEFGYVAVYLRKKDELKPWLDDARAKIQAFARRRILGLDRRIADEQRRAEQDLELRKRSYGSK